MNSIIAKYRDFSASIISIIICLTFWLQLMIDLLTTQTNRNILLNLVCVINIVNNYWFSTSVVILYLEKIYFCSY